MLIRVATIDDLPILQAIERAAGECFRDVGMPEIADDQPFALDVLGRYQREGRALVVGERPVAYLIADELDGNVHVEQVSVHPSHARQGLGRSLLDHLAAHADGSPALTLITFGHVPWNAPYYARCGFRTLDDTELTPGLRALRRREATLGLDRWPRVCMRRDLG